MRSKHRETHGIYEQAFETSEELDAFLAEYQPTAHLTYITTSVYACYGNKEQLIELHQHLTGNPDWELARFEELAAAMGAEVIETETYSNVSSAVSMVARFDR